MAAPKISVIVPHAMRSSAADLSAVARHVEDVGLDGVFVGDHLAAAALQQLSGGRVIPSSWPAGRRARRPRPTPCLFRSAREAPGTTGSRRSLASGPVTSARATFRALHERGCFVIPNPWDRGTVRALEALGFPALATTSAGFGFTRAVPDVPGALSVEAVLEHVAELVDAATVPVSADFQNGYARDVEGVAANVRRCVETGVAGLSIEDTGEGRDSPLFELARAVERVRAARAAIDASGADVMLTARAECFLAAHPDPVRESIRRLQAYAEAGADVLYAPGVRDRDDIRAIVEAVHPKPVNVLISANIGLRVADLAGLGVRRVSVGSALARAAWGGFLRAAGEIAQEGSFASLDTAAPSAELNALFEER
jgi:2-methylisocitrate lyase-like PEP mutase family enzyme